CIRARSVVTAHATESQPGKGAIGAPSARLASSVGDRQVHGADTVHVVHQFGSLPRQHGLQVCLHGRILQGLIHPSDKEGFATEAFAHHVHVIRVRENVTGRDPQAVQGALEGAGAWRCHAAVLQRGGEKSDCPRTAFANIGQHILQPRIIGSFGGIPVPQLAVDVKFADVFQVSVRGCHGSPVSPGRSNLRTSANRVRTAPAKLAGRDRGRICTAPGSIGVPPYIALPLTAWPVLPTIAAPALLATQTWTTERAADGDGTSLDTGPQRRWRDERMHMDRNSEVRSTLRPQESDIGQELLRLFLHKHRPVPKRPAFSRTSTIIVRKELLPFYYAIYDHDLCRFVELQYRN